VRIPYAPRYRSILPCVRKILVRASHDRLACDDVGLPALWEATLVYLGKHVEAAQHECVSIERPMVLKRFGQAKLALDVHCIAFQAMQHELEGWHARKRLDAEENITSPLFIRPKSYA